MSTTFGTSPRDGLGEIIKTKDLAYITSSGMYNLQITSATYNKVTSAKNGNEYQFMSIAGPRQTALQCLTVQVSSLSPMTSNS